MEINLIILYKNIGIKLGSYKVMGPLILGSMTGPPITCNRENAWTENLKRMDLHEFNIFDIIFILFAFYISFEVISRKPCNKKEAMQALSKI